MEKRIKEITVLGKDGDAEFEACSCFVGYNNITPLYIYSMWGGAVAMGEIVNAMEEVGKKGDENKFYEYDS